MKIKKWNLSLEERQRLYLMHESGSSFREIGRSLGRNVTTVARELKRNAAPHHIRRGLTVLEKAKYAHDKAEFRNRERVRKRARKLELRQDVAQRVLALFRETKYSPETIADIMSCSDMGIKLCGKSIRRWIAKHHRNYRQYFPHRGKRPRRCLTPIKSRKARREEVPQLRSIHERPLVVAERSRVGDFELDMLVCSQSSVSILSIRERKTRRCWLELVDDLKSDTVRRGIIKVIQRIPPNLLLTFTFDRGSEFRAAPEFEKFFGVVSYFCDAYCAWQKGAVELQNKEVRIYIPKGTNLAEISEPHLKRVEALINAKPRICLERLTAGDAWFFALRHAKGLLH